MKTVYLLLLWGLYACAAQAQKENNIWAFGDSLGLDFTSGSPVVIGTHVLSSESSAAISDPDGKLLFYCGTYNASLSRGFCALWDATHHMMPNGDSLIGNKYTSSTQGVTIVPFLDGSNKYYLFLQASRENLWDEKDYYLRYSIVDMDLRGGLGDVVPGYKNIIIDSFVSEKMVVALGPGCSLWLLNHRCDTNVFHAFKIDAAGISSTAVISGFPSVRAFSYKYPPENPYAVGSMDVSADGRFIATCNYNTPAILDLYDFNKSTGVVSNQLSIDSIFSYWVHFSPDGNKLYTVGPVAQYNLSLLPSLSAVKASRYVLEDTLGWTGMRTGPDKKIYYTDRKIITGISGADLYLHRIGSPDLAAPACGAHNFMKMAHTETGFNGLGPSIIVPPVSDTVSFRWDTALCFTPGVLLSAPAGYRDYTWQDGTRGKVCLLLHPGKT